MYRRVPFRRRRYVPSQALTAIVPQVIPEEPKKDLIQLKNIPLPNEVESREDTKVSARSNPFSNIFKRIRIDDLILLGLVFLFLDEGRNEPEDDFLLVILLYLFLAGRD
ncbi:MAG: hypothetical protein N2484_09360 [Clostridia bacterium]|nr:hypothetical protein [Clostridia bacterium]